MSFLSSEDIANAEHFGQFELDRKRALERSVDALPFFSSLFPRVSTFGEIANRLVAKLRASRSATIGIEVYELLNEDDHDGALPTLGAAVEAIASRDPGYSLTLPARTIPNPFLPDKVVQIGGRTLSIQALLLDVCLIKDDDLISGSEESVRCKIIGLVWDWTRGRPSA